MNSSNSRRRPVPSLVKRKDVQPEVSPQPEDLNTAKAESPKQTEKLTTGRIEEAGPLSAKGKSRKPAKKRRRRAPHRAKRKGVQQKVVEKPAVLKKPKAKSSKKAKNPRRLLIVTVGSAPEPVAASTQRWQPERIVFVPSSQTVTYVEDVRDLLEDSGYYLHHAEFEVVSISDPQDFTKCVQQMRTGLEQQLRRWRSCGEDHECIADFTGGTKCMSASLALVAQSWPGVRFSYVGGSKRDKGGVGIVISGQEHVVASANPWDVLGYQAVEDAVAAFDSHDYAWGAELLENARQNADDEKHKDALGALALLMNSYDLWDRLEYGKAFAGFEECARRQDDLVAALAGIVGRADIRKHLAAACKRLPKLRETDLNAQHIEDLLAIA
ncbi:MAG: TIGR02710 family CRISPR-associated CARF protein, partial [Betaproteobacteria bacterium]|nr:TIGR02710 family CRISPR-associated CARF protein [Betaproteobacteria bacterium]